MYKKLNKVPRGSINHSLFESFYYLISSFFANLSNSKKIIEFEN